MAVVIARKSRGYQTFWLRPPFAFVSTIKELQVVYTKCLFCQHFWMLSMGIIPTLTLLFGREIVDAIQERGNPNIPSRPSRVWGTQFERLLAQFHKKIEW